MLVFFSDQFRDSDVFFSYLPLAHIFDRVIEELFISTGASIGFWRGVSHNDLENFYTVYVFLHIYVHVY